MSAHTADTTQVVATAIREISQIATLPEVTLKIVELVENPSSTAQDLHAVISNDPALCARILKVVNSSFYGMPGQIGSINRAIVLLGLNAVKNIAISASLTKLFKGGQLTPNFAAKDLWKHSIATATASRILAKEVELGVTDEAFLGGMIHDIGLMVELQHDRNKLIDVLTQLGVDDEGAPKQDMLELEKRIFGATHQDFGRALCDKWKFPKSLAAVAGNHHNPLDLTDGVRTLGCVVYLADRVAAAAVDGFRLDLVTLDVDPDVLDVLGLDGAAVERVIESLPDQLTEVETLFT